MTPDNFFAQDFADLAQPQAAPEGGNFFAQDFSDAPVAQAAPIQQQPAAPSTSDYLQANPVFGAPVQTLLRGGQGLEQLGARGLADLSDLGGHFPNPISQKLHGLSDYIDQSVNAQNQQYEGARQRVVGASTNPRVTDAATATGEVMGNMLSPVGLVGNFVGGGPITRGLASGAAFGASQPVLDNNSSDYWLAKAKQILMNGAVGGLTAGATQALSPRAAPVNMTERLKNAATDAYSIAEEQGVNIKQPVVQSAVSDIADTIENRGIDPALQPKSSAVLARFKADAENGDMTLKKAETLRRIAGAALDSPDKSDRALAHTIIDKWDDFIGGLKPEDVTGGVTADPKLAKAFNLPMGGNPTEATDALSQARDLYARSAKSATMDRLQERAKNAVGANYSQAGYQTAIRQQFRALANNDAAFRRFSPDEQQAILSVVRGGPAENALRYIGKLSIRGPVSAIPAMAALHYGGPEAAGAMEVLGESAKMGSNMLAQRGLQNALDLVRNGSSAPRPVPPLPQANPALGAMNPFVLQMLLHQRAQ